MDEVVKMCGIKCCDKKKCVEESIKRKDTLTASLPNLTLYPFSSPLQEEMHPDSTILFPMATSLSYVPVVLPPVGLHVSIPNYLLIHVRVVITESLPY